MLLNTEIIAFLFSKRLNHNYLPLKARIVYCNGYVLPHIDYCNNIWGSTHHCNRDKILKWQKRASCMIFDDYDTPGKELLSKVKWLPVHNRITHSKAVLVYKSLHNLVPKYIWEICSLISQTVCIPYSQRHKEIWSLNLELSYTNKVCDTLQWRAAIPFLCQLDSAAL